MCLIIMHQQVWFVLLMAFVLSWSTVSIANAQSKHSLKLHHVDVDTAQGHTASTAVSCHDVSESSSVNKHVTPSHEQGCLDCHAMHCQNLNVMLETDTMTIHPPYVPILKQFNGQYLSQDQNGYWQEILRPPKT